MSNLNNQSSQQRRVVPFRQQDEPPERSGGQAILTGQLPFSQEAEEAVIGAVIVNPDAFVEVSAFLQPEDFYILRNTYIWEALGHLNQRNDAIDIVTLREELRVMNRLTDVGGPAYIMQLSNSVPTSMHAAAYGHIVEAAAIRRRLLLAADEIKGMAMDEELPISKISEDAESRLFRVTERSTLQRAQTMRTAIKGYLEYIGENKAVANDDRAFPGIPTGIPGIDDQIKGLQRGLVYLWCGISGHAKTDTLLNVVLNSARLGSRNLLFSLEMEVKTRVLNKMISMMTALPHENISAGKLTAREWEKFEKAADQLEKLPIVFYDTMVSRTPWSTIVSIAKATRRHGLDAIFIDYTGLISSGGVHKQGTYDDRVYGVQNLRLLARELNVPVVALHQINKRRVTTKFKRPDDTEYLEYGGENDADVVIVNYKGGKYNSKIHPNHMEFIILKNRDGLTPTSVFVDHDGATARISEWIEPELRPQKPEFAPSWVDEALDRVYADDDADDADDGSSEIDFNA